MSAPATAPAATPSDSDGPVTVIVSRRMKPGTEAWFAEWIQGVISDGVRFPGHLGVDVIRPPNAATGDFVLVFRFETYGHLRAWEESPVRADWLKRAEPYAAGAPVVRRVTGLEYWFRPPGLRARPPSLHKLALVMVLGLYPLLILAVPPLRSLLHGLPELIAALVATLILVYLVTSVVMPVVARRLAAWLSPKPPVH
jgi:antibiotic biosynthesis monooxygenase (ABM) superfamily enzyme